MDHRVGRCRNVPPLLVANLATLAVVAALLTGSLVSHRDDRVSLWGERPLPRADRSAISA